MDTSSSAAAFPAEEALGQLPEMRAFRGRVRTFLSERVCPPPSPRSHDLSYGRRCLSIWEDPPAEEEEEQRGSDARLLDELAPSPVVWSASHLLDATIRDASGQGSTKQVWRPLEDSEGFSPLPPLGPNAWTSRGRRFTATSPSPQYYRPEYYRTSSVEGSLSTTPLPEEPDVAEAFGQKVLASPPSKTRGRMKPWPKRASRY